MTTLDDLLAPKSVAIVGASDNPERIGGRPIQKFQNLGYEGHIYPVNPNRDVVQGIQAYPTLSDISGEVDFVLVAVPAKGVLDVVREAATKKAKTVMIFSSGFSAAEELSQTTGLFVYKAGRSLAHRMSPSKDLYKSSLPPSLRSLCFILFHGNISLKFPKGAFHSPAHVDVH